MIVVRLLCFLPTILLQMSELCCCCCFSAELQGIRSLVSDLIIILNQNAPDNNRPYHKQLATINLMQQRLANFPYPNLATIDFHDVGLSDVTVRMGRWSGEQARLMNIIHLVETRLGAAVHKMPGLCNNLKTLALDIAPVIQRAIAAVIAG